MKKLFVIGIFLSCSITMLGQVEAASFNVVSSSSSSNFSKITSYGRVSFDNGEPSPDTVGSPYLDENYQLGSILKDSIVVAENIALKYNVYNDVFIGKITLDTKEDESKTVIKSEEFKIMMGKNLFVPLPSYGNPNALQYYQVLVIGNKGTLFKKNEKTYKERVIATTSLTRDIPPAFKDKETFYYKDSEGNFNEISTSKKKLLVLFGNKKKQMTDFIKKNSLNIKKEEDLIRLFRFYETL